MNKFKQFKQFYQDNKFDVLLREEGSIYWLKLRSISRKELLVEFCNLANIDCSGVLGNALFEYIYNAKPKEELLDKFIAQKYASERLERKANETALVSELYKMKVFDWGGLYQNNLERTIVDNYIKKIRSFNLLNEKIENEIHESMRGYVQSSWYNHWTSILIEDIFKDHKIVTPTVGLIKKVDFFIGGIPFDLKVTYFPEGFMAASRKAKGLPTELQILKRFAKTLTIKYNREQKVKALFAELITRIEESQKSKAKAVMAHERSLGFEPNDVSGDKVGYDIESKIPGSGRLRFIEVKGRATGAKTVTVSKNEILTCLNKPDEFFLAIVEVDGESREIHYVPHPFQKELDFAVTSVNYSLEELKELARG